VLAVQRDTAALAVCEVLIDGRARLLERVEQRLRWFAAHPETALRSSHRRPNAKRRALTARASDTAR
jgi:hypothetical protein